MLGIAEQNSNNVKAILEDVPPGFYVDSKWFKAQGITRSSVSDYTANGWLEHVAHGVYRRPLSSSFEQSGFDDWQVLVLSLQKIMDYAVHVGGLTALKRQGHGHYVSLSQEKDVFLYSEKLPGWVVNVPLNAPLTSENPICLRRVRKACSSTEHHKETRPGGNGLSCRHRQNAPFLRRWMNCQIRSRFIL